MRDLPINLGQGCLQGDMAPWLRLCLRKNAFSLQIEYLFLTLSFRAYMFG